MSTPTGENDALEAEVERRWQAILAGDDEDEGVLIVDLDAAVGDL